LIDGLNHITLAVRNLDDSFYFYTELLGMIPKAKWKSGAYLSSGGLWFCLSVDDSVPSKDYSHIAFNISVEKFPKLKARLLSAKVNIWKQNKSEGESFYLTDPDGHKLEIHVGGLASRLKSLTAKHYDSLQLF